MHLPTRPREPILRSDLVPRRSHRKGALRPTRSAWRQEPPGAWLGIEQGTDFDPAHFEPADANRRLDAVVLAATRAAA
jgi:hypothetical protein